MPKSPPTIMLADILDEARKLEPTHRHFSPEEDEVLRQCYGKVRVREMAARWPKWFGRERCANSLTNRAAKLGLQRSAR